MTQPRSLFTLTHSARQAELLPRLTDLTAHHRTHCPPYDRILRTVHGAAGHGDGLAALPWLPVGLFKTHRLLSITDDEVFRIVRSTGTTGTPSTIHLDRRAAADQQRALTATLRHLLGPTRPAMLIFDTSAVLDRARPLSTRGAGILGMMSVGRDYTFAADPDGRADRPAVDRFLAAHGNRPFLLFGFTHLVWTLLADLTRDRPLDLGNGTLLHSGGWKKLADLHIPPEEFRRNLAGHGLTRVHNYYGMVEQLGTIHLEGPDGDGLYCPDFADVIIRDPDTWREQSVGQPGLVQVVSTLPRSYPGHSLLTEDLGVVHGIDDGAWPGKRFSVLGRLHTAEARGCSDNAEPTR